MKESSSVPQTGGRRSLTNYMDHPGLNAFLKRQGGSGTGNHLISVTFPVPAIDPLAALEMLANVREFNFYWEKPDREFAISAGGELKRLKAAGPDRFRIMAQQVAKIKSTSAGFALQPHSLAGLHLLGGFSFFDHIRSPRWNRFGAASLALPEWLLITEGNLGLLTLNMELKSEHSGPMLAQLLEKKLAPFEEMFRMHDGLNDELRPNRPAFTPAGRFTEPDYQWIESVHNARQLIHSNTFEKIVLAREVIRESDSAIAPTHIMHILRSQYPTCYNFLVTDREGRAFIGSSPERLVSFQNRFLHTESLAGSIHRGRTATEDLYLEKRLYNSEKNRNEHSFVIRAIENRLRPFVREIEKATIPGIKKLKNVQHLYTPIRGRLNRNANPFAILEQLHPTPAVGGYPRENAVPYIERLETFDRGWYAGPVGWLNLNGGGEFAVAIRSSLIEENRARIFAGCGIVYDSDPLTEWEETNLKLMPMLSAFEDDEARHAE